MNSEPDPRAAQPNQSVWARTTTEAAEEDEENSPSNPKPRITDNTDEQMPFAFIRVHSRLKFFAEIEDFNGEWYASGRSGRAIPPERSRDAPHP